MHYPVRKRVGPGFIFLSISLIVFVLTAPGLGADQKQGPPPAPVKVSAVQQKNVTEQISLIGTTEPIAVSTVAAEVSGIVEHYPIREGDFVRKGQPIARLKSIDLKLRLTAAAARREQIRANLLFAEKEYKRAEKLKNSNSIAEKNYDEAFYNYQALSQGLAASEAEIDQLEYEIDQKTVYAPFSGFVAEEHTQIGEWIHSGGGIATIVDLQQVRVTVDVPERYSVMVSPRSRVNVIIRSISSEFLSGEVYAILPQGNPDARTFPVRINLANPDYQVKSGMEATVLFDLADTKNALLVPKDAVITAGNNRMVFAVFQGKAVPVNVRVLGYYDGHVAVEGDIHPGVQVIVRGNERLMPGQPVQIVD